ncbi:hypothetical protein YPPY01_1476, partial [Yersinia pestis PY-01]
MQTSTSNGGNAAARASIAALSV